MQNLGELVTSVLSTVGKGGKASSKQLERIRAEKAKYKELKRDLNDRVDGIKGEVKQIEHRILRLAKERDQESGTVADMVAEQLEDACVELGGKKATAQVLFSKLRALTKVVGKLEALEEALREGITEEQADQLKMECEEAFSALERTDTATEEVSQVTYRRTEGEAVDVEKFTRDIGEKPPLSAEARKMVDAIRARASEPEGL
ncbi:MAG: hypothetical protein GX456_07050 [Verrucomicrobia bacterium]|nr:hypothetical protein [Verrucomicrobiota bacterium]